MNSEPALMKYVLILVLLFYAGLPLRAEGISCESSPAVEAAQRELYKKLETATFEQARALREQAYKAMRRLDPNDYRPIRRSIWFVRYELPEQFDEFREQAVAEARAHPEDPAKVTAAASALTGKDTPEALRLMDQVLASSPSYAPAYVELAGMYKLGKFTDKDKAAALLEKYYRLCPAGLDDQAAFYLKQLGSNDLKTQVAKNLRERLATVTDPHVLPAYSNVWSLEFSTIPVAEHPKERQRVADDVRHLQQLPIEASAEWLNFLKEGDQQSGAPETQIKTIEDRISREFPHSNEAFRIWYESWNELHPPPAGEASAGEWQQYMRLAVAHYRELTQLFPQVHGFGDALFEYVSHLDAASNEEIVHESDAYIKESDLYEGPSSSPRRSVANVLVDCNIQPARALALLQKASRLRGSPRETVFSETADYMRPKDIQEWEQRRAIDQAQFDLLYLRACRVAGDRSAAEAVKATVESAPPTDRKLMSPYWNARALLAEIEGRKTDALAYYQKTLFVREPPKKQYGKLNDTVLADARRLWNTTQGSEAAFAIWSQPENANTTTLAEGRWEKPDKDLPQFELADLQGKTWKLSSLEGKKVLINVWATWCGPCQWELPHLQKLYDQTKSRSDIAILTLNFDEDIGTVEPFVKKKGYTFPVLPAYALLENKIDVNSIPRNWLIDTQGKWQAEQFGFDPNEADWEKNMLARLEATK
jgi:thiol-disulfide isomerase/thioredoxin